MRKSNRGLYLTALLALLILIGVGYAVLTATLTIKGQTEVKKTTWDVHFENVRIKENGIHALEFFDSKDEGMSQPLSSEALSKLNATTLNYRLKFVDSENTSTALWGMINSEFYVDIVNRGTVDAIPVSGSIVVPTVESPINNFLNVSCLYCVGSDCEPDSRQLTTTLDYRDIKLSEGQSMTIKCTHTAHGTSQLTESDLEALKSVQDRKTINIQLSMPFKPY